MRWLDEHFVHVTPAPGLAGLEAANDRVAGLVEVLRGMPPRRIVAATDATAGEAQAEVDPAAVRLETLLAALRGTGSNVASLIEMRALFGHRPPE